MLRGTDVDEFVMNPPLQERGHDLLHDGEEGYRAKKRKELLLCSP
jgi:hypothetical protein